MKTWMNGIRTVLAVIALFLGVAHRSLSQSSPSRPTDDLKSVPGRAKRSDSVVKASFKVELPDSTGRRLVIIRLAIDEGWYIYGNPVGNSEMEGSETVVDLMGGRGKLVEVRYPKGTIRKEKLLDNEIEYQVYEGTVTIQAVVEPPTEGSMELAVRFGACNYRGSCLQPATVKFVVK